MLIRRETMAQRTVHAVQRLPITKARINLGQLARRAHVNKEYFILEKDGIPIIGIMDADELEDYLELQDPKVRADIAKSSKEFRAGKGRSAREFLAELQGVSKRSKTSKRHSKV